MSGAPSKPWEDNETIDLTGDDRFVDSRSSRKKSIVVVRDDDDDEENEKSLSSAISSKKPSSKLISPSTLTPMSPKIEAESRQFLALNGLTPSIEQAAVVKALIEGQHASVNAVAGSGKTTSVIMLAAYLHAESRGRRILLLTYNKKLKEETRDRIVKLGLQDVVEAHSFHAAGVKYYSDACMRDDGLKHSVLLNTGWRKTPARWDFVVIDEAQDVDRLKFAFVMKLIGKSMAGGGSPPQFLIIGDVRQSIYSYRGTDERFLRLSNHIGAILTTLVLGQFLDYPQAFASLRRWRTLFRRQCYNQKGTLSRLNRKSNPLPPLSPPPHQLLIQKLNTFEVLHTRLRKMSQLRLSRC